MRGLALAGALLVGCVPADREASPAEVVEHAWALIDERYALFLDKEVDWSVARTDALAEIEEPGASSDTALFDAVAGMLEQLEDAHVNLVSWFETSWEPSYLQDRIPTYDEDLVQRGVLGFEFREVGALRYAVVDKAWAYLRVSDFTNIPGSDALDRVFDTLNEADQLVLDLRDNGGGRLTQAGVLAERIIDEPRVGWRVQTSTGPAHDALSEPQPEILEPAAVRFEGAVHVLVDGRSYSATNTFTFAVGGVDGVRVVGQPTGGGAGSPSWFELPNGWLIRFPTRRLTGPDGESVEAGYRPDKLAEPDPALSAKGRDAMIEAALGP